MVHSDSDHSGVQVLLLLLQKYLNTPSQWQVVQEEKEELTSMVY